MFSALPVWTFHRHHMNEYASWKELQTEFRQLDERIGQAQVVAGILCSQLGRERLAVQRLLRLAAEDGRLPTHEPPPGNPADD
jgi:hypothetical protein